MLKTIFAKRSIIHPTSKLFSTQFTSKVLMVEPTHFFLNEETFADNKFMNKVTMSMEETTQKAIDEFRKFKEQIEKAGVEVEAYKQQSIETPDSVFPNNWFSTHKGVDFPGKLIHL